MEEKSRLLIIDDEEVVLDSCTQILEGGNYEIATASNGAAGLRLLDEFSPDVTYVDLKMPGISGLEVVEQIHEYDPTIVTIVITGYPTVSSAVEAMKKGAFDFLPKPFTPDEFRLITRRGLEKRQLVLETIALRKEKEMLRDQFAAIVSHELRSPLGAVQQNLINLREELADQLNDSQKARFDRVTSRIDDLLKLILTWLRVISVDIGKLRENFKPTPLAVVITKAIESVEPHAIRKDIEIKANMEDDLGFIHGDEGTLTEAVVNIIGNAVKFSHMSSQVLVKACQEGDRFIISVKDYGIGIPKEDLPYIFNDFFSGRLGTTSERGSGLGLAITRRIVEAHEGAITVTSEPGLGSTFVISLPGPNNHTTNPSIVQAAALDNT